MRQGLLYGRRNKRKGFGTSRENLYFQREKSKPLSFIDDLVNLAKKKKTEYIGLTSGKMCTFCMTVNF